MERLKARAVLGGPTTLEEAEAAERAVLEEQVREARLAFARNNARWTEVSETALVPRGRWLVHADTDELLCPHPGLVFQPRSASPIADVAPLAFYVTREGELVFLEPVGGTWSERVASAARKRARA